MSYLIMGRPVSYWNELEASRSKFEQDLILENATLRAKVHYFEDMVNKASRFIKQVDGNGRPE